MYEVPLHRPSVLLSSYDTNKRTAQLNVGAPDCCVQRRDMGSREGERSFLIFVSISFFNEFGAVRIIAVHG
jgi:hypothetical protein